MLTRKCTPSALGKRFASSLRSQFEQNGFIGKHPIMSAQEMSKYLTKFEAYEKSQPNGKLQPQEINLHFKHRWILDLCIHPRVLNAVEAQIGPNIVLLSSTIFTKYPPAAEEESAKNQPGFVGWHQDLKYWGLQSVKKNDSRINLTSMWLAIEEANEENGAMQFIAKSHKSGFFEHVQSDTEGNLLNENQDMLLTKEWQESLFQSKLQPGECTFHDGYLVHGSRPTLSTRRMGLAVQYCQPSLEFVPMTYTKSNAFTEDFRKPVLVRGYDVFGKMRYVKTVQEMKNQALN